MKFGVPKKLRAITRGKWKRFVKVWNKNKRLRFAVFTVGLLIMGFSAGLVAERFNNESSDTDSSVTGRSVETLPTGVAGGEVTPIDNDITASNLLKATNRERKKASVSNLKIHDKLSDSALAKCKHMIKNDYWSHDAPDGTKWQLFIQNERYNYSISGENLAYGFATSSGVITGWMNSETHRKNLLTKDYTEVGFGICESKEYQGGPATIVVQHLATPGTAPASQQYTPEPYRASVCKKTRIPYETVYEEVSYLYVGETDEYGGYDGYIQKCTADSTGYKPPDFTIDPIDKTVLVGTKPLPPEEP